MLGSQFLRRSRRQRRALVGVTASAAMVAASFAALPISAQAAAPAKTTPAGTADAPAPPLGSEVVSLRTEYSKTITTLEGLETTFSPQPLNYRDSKGQWQPIDSRLVADDAAGSGWRNTAAGYQVHFPANLAAGPVTVTANGKSVSWTLPGASSATGEVSGKTITYRSVLRGSDVSFIATPTGVKESIVVADRLAAAALPAEQFTTSTGLTLSKGNAGAATVADEQGKPAFEIPPASAVDAANVPATAAQASFALGQVLRSVTPVSVALDPGWLTAPARKFPITIDPSVTLPVTSPGDCTIASGVYANTTGCSNTTNQVGEYPGVLYSRSLLHFDVSSIPPSAVVRNAKLVLTAVDSSPSPLSSPLNIEAHALARSYTSAATWNKYNGTNSWTTAGGDFSSPVAGTLSLSGTVTAGSQYNLFAPDLVQAWITGATANDGVLLKANPDASGEYVRFDSTEASSGDPTLVVDWSDGIGTPTTAISRSTNDKCSVQVAVTNGNDYLSCTEFNIGGVGMPLTLSRVYNGRQTRYNTNNADMMLGRNRWQLSFGKYLQRLGSGSFVYWDGTGKVVPFRPDGSGGWITPPGLDASLTQTDTGPSEYTIAFHASGMKYAFKRQNTDPGNNFWQLWKISDRNSNAITITYYPNKPGYSLLGALNYITDTRGRTITASWISPPGLGFDLISGLTDSDGRSTSYGYDTAGNLTSATDTNGKTTNYTYASATGASYDRELTNITDARGHQTTDIGYDGATGRVTTLTMHPDASTDYASSFSYNETASQPTTTFTDERGFDTTYKYENRAYTSRVTQVTDALGHTQGTGYTPDAHVGATTDAYSQQTTYSYGANPTNSGTGITSTGESLTKTQSAMGTTQTASYDSSACSGSSGGDAYQPKCGNDSAGHTSTYQYDGIGNLSQNTNSGSGGSAATAKLTHAYGSHCSTTDIHDPCDGRIKDSTDPLNRVTTYHYSDYVVGSTHSQRLDSIIAPTGSQLGTRTFSYDDLDRLTSYTTGGSTTTTLSYDDDDRVLTTDYSDTIGTDITNTYDNNGNLTSRASALFGGKTTSYSYDWLNRLTSQTLPDGTVLSYTYDEFGNLTQLQQTVGVRTLTTGYSYDAVENLTTLTEPGGNIDVFRYDDNNKRTDTWDKATGYSLDATKNYVTGNPTGFAVHINSRLDDAGRLKEIKTTRASSDSTVVADFSYCHNSGSGCAGGTDTDQLFSEKDIVTGVVTNYTYDNANRLLTADNPANSGTDYTYSYDANGNRTSALTPAGNTYAAYDAGNGLCKTQTTASPSCPSDSDSSTTGRNYGGVYKYDACGNQTQNPTAAALTYNGADMTDRQRQSRRHLLQLQLRRQQPGRPRQHQRHCLPGPNRNHHHLPQRH